MSLPVHDGLLVVVKRDCETCHLVVDVLDQIPDLVIASQDDPTFPHPDVIDDTALELSWYLQTETTPTVYRIRDGEIVEQVAGWHRERWEETTGISGLGPGLPDTRPGCGSIIFEPDVHERLLREHSDSALRSRRVELGGSEDPFEAMFARGWSDGLPLVPPTEERVERMLAGTGRDPSDVVCVLAPDLVDCTVEKVAVNAVMAGCLPEYLPVVLAAVEAVATDTFNIHGVAATTYFSSPIVIVNGPVTTRLGMNSGINVLGPGNRPNVTIGRALNLVIRNVGGSSPGGVDRATFGHPGKLSFCFPEDEAGSPWESLAVERGFEETQSTVTLFAGHGPTEIWDQLSRSAESLAGSFAGQLMRLTHTKLAIWFDAVVVVSPEHARVFREAGWSKDRLRGELLDRLTRPGSELLQGADGIAEGMPESFAADDVPKFRPGGLWFVHAGGGAGLFSAILPGWSSGPRGSEMTTVAIR
ncbi:MAG: thioredoxin [Acidimicrobiia bacterium]